MKGIKRERLWANVVCNSLFLGSFFVFGLFYEAAACVFGGLAGAFFTVCAVRQKNMRFYCNMESLVMVIVIFGYLTAGFYGVDAGMGWIGFLKMQSVLFFLCCVMQLSEEEREAMLGRIPAVGCVMVGFGLLSYVAEPLYPFFFTADRFGGFFQYANVSALFELTGIVILVTERQKRRYFAAELGLLILGILLSGSRTVFFLAAATGIFWGITDKKARIPVIAVLLSVPAGAAAYVWLTRDVQNIGRFLTTSVSASTLLGRVLYAKDGLRLLCKYPFGLGYLGYSFLEPSIQTGVYSVRFVHNDLLQIALDIGVVPALLFACVLIRNIFGGRPGEGARTASQKKRLILGVLCAHCLVDFDLEFTSMWFVLILTLDLYRGREINLSVGGAGAFHKVLAGLSAAAGLYTGIAMAPWYLGAGGLTVSLLPFYTEAKREMLAVETDGVLAEQMAEELLRQNAYVPEACDVLAVRAYQKGDYLRMIDYKRRSLRLQKYDMEAYERYVALLAGAAARADAAGDTELLDELARAVAEVDAMRREVEEQTDRLAYQIRDLPDFTFAEEVEDYIRQFAR